MRFVGSFVLICALLFTGSSFAQQTPTAGSSPVAVSPEAHQASIELVKAASVRGNVAKALPASIDQGVAALKAHCTDCTDAFYAEWKKRMLKKMDPEVIVAIYVDEYEQHFTVPEMRELATVVAAHESDRPVTPSPALQAKLDATFASTQTEIVGKCTALGSKSGVDAYDEIVAEHPEYVKAAPAPVPSPAAH